MSLYRRFFPLLFVLGALLVLLAVLSEPVWLANVVSSANSEKSRVPIGQGTLTIIAPSESLEVGDLFTLSIAAQVDQPLSAFQFDLSYDESVLDFRSLEVGSANQFLGSTGREVVCPPLSQDAQTVRMACASTGANVGPTGDGTLAQFTLEAIGSGVSDLVLSEVLLADSSRPPNELAVTLQNAQLTVLGDPTATATATTSPTATPTDVPTLTATPTVAETLTATPTVAETLTATPTVAETLTATPTVAETLTATPTDVPAVTVTPTGTPAATSTGTPQPTVTSTPTASGVQIYLPLILSQ